MRKISEPAGVSAASSPPVDFEWRSTVTRVLTGIGIALFAAFVFLGAYRALVDRRVDHLWQTLQGDAGTDVFDPTMVAQLPEPARRYLRHAIRPGAVLARSVVLQMRGRIALTFGADKTPLRARQLLAAQGLIWQASVGAGARRISGHDLFADGEGSMRWFMWGIVPIVQASGPDLSRSAAGRVALEVALWLPSALLPQAGARWEAVEGGRARVHLSVDGERLAPVLTIADDGRLTRIEMQRWDTDGLSGTPAYVPWVGDSLGEETTFDGYTIATHVRATAKAGTPQANEFFEAVVTDAVYR
jgi:hypothetical protein